MKYSIDWIKKLYEEGETLKYVFFLGHQPRKDRQISKSCFSQWWEQKFKVDGIEYKSAEHWMMSEKARLFKDQEILEKIIESQTPAEAKKLGRSIRNFDGQEWNENKYEIVKRGNFHKFNQDESLKTFLLTTKNRILVEASPYDKIWGIGMKEGGKGIENPINWQGENLLGFAIMEIRDEILNKL